MTTKTGTATPDALTEFIHQWASAIVSNDVHTMAPFVTDDWVLIDRPGVITRDVFHAVVEKEELRHTAMEHEVLDIRRLGNDFAIILTRGRSTAIYQGHCIDADEWTTNVVVRGPGGWRCLMTQLTPAAPR